MLVVVLGVFGKDSFELSTVTDEDAVETLATGRTDEALGVGVRPRGTHRCADDLDSFGAEDLVEVGRELGVSVSHQVSHGTGPLCEHHR
jgi:hypothetical protein